MRVINTRNVHNALPAGLDLLNREGMISESRGGTVMAMPCPVTTEYDRPKERVIFWPERNANPFFHFFEALWMLAGRDDLGYLTPFVKTFKNFSDDGETLWGAYGNRWRNWFTIDQILWAVNRLKADPSDRRTVISMWDARRDTLQAKDGGNDIPCNTHLYLRIDRDMLHITVCCRSNDMIWGAYGANAVHFSVLQEVLAGFIGVGVGKLWQVSNNYHAYKKTLKPIKHLADFAPDPFRKWQDISPYEQDSVKPYPMVSVPMSTWLMDLEMFMEDPTAIGYRDKFFRRVALPMWNAHRMFKEASSHDDKFQGSSEILEQCVASDWKKAGTEWIERRREQASEQSGTAKTT